MRLDGRKAWYVLVDPAVGDPLLDCEGRSDATPIAIKHADFPRHFRPYLLELGEFGRDVRIDRVIRIAVDEATRASPNRGAKRSICGWIASERSPAAIAASLARQARIHVRNQPRMLRIWDPRTLDLLQHLLGPRSAELLTLHGIDWWWLGRNGHVKELASARVPNETALHAHLSEQQLEALLLAEPLHATLNVIQDMRGDPTADSSLRTIITALRRVSTKWGVVDPLEQVCFALHACLVHADFDSDAKVSEAMRRSMEAGDAPTRALSSFDDEAWSAVRRRLHKPDSSESVTRNGERHHG